MKKMKNWVVSISLVSMFAVFYSCSSDDSFMNELDAFERFSAARSVNTDYDEILYSSEFQNLNKAYSELISVVRSLLANMTQDDIEKMLELQILYKGDSIKYESVYNYFAYDTFFKDKYDNAVQVYRTFLNAKEKLLMNEEYKTYIENNENFISFLLMQNAGQVPSIQNSIRTIKTRSEEEIRACLDECKSIYDKDVFNAQALLACKTALNIVSCLLSKGATINNNVKDELLAMACYEYEMQRATEKYENCKKECEK